MTKELHHFYKIVNHDLFKNSLTNLFELWFTVQFDRGDSGWTKEYPASCFIHDRRTMVYTFRYMRLNIGLDDQQMATKILVGKRKKDKRGQ